MRAAGAHRAALLQPSVGIAFTHDGGEIGVGDQLFGVADVSVLAVDPQPHRQGGSRSPREPSVEHVPIV
jgi:hypothetical protein